MTHFRSCSSIIFSPKENGTALEPDVNAPFQLTSPDMLSNIEAVEKILNYSFRNKALLKEALTHPSYTGGGGGSGAASYQRLEFVGDAALGLAFSNHMYLAYPNLDAGKMTLLRSANVCTEKLARVAVKWRLFEYVKHNTSALDSKVREFAEAVSQEDESVIYGGSVKAPKILADIVESVAAAIYVDLNFDLQALWVTFRHLLEPIVTPEDLHAQPQPVTMLFELLQKQGKHVDIRHWKKGSKCIFSVYVDGKFVFSSSHEQRDIAKLDAAKGALYKLNAATVETTESLDWMNGTSEIEGAKQKLQELCGKKKWSNPSYKIEKDQGPPHEKKFVCSVQIVSEKGVHYKIGDQRSKLKKAKNSAASFMIRALRESGLL